MAAFGLLTMKRGAINAIADCLRTPGAPDPAQRLVRAAVESSGRDNTTALELELIAPAAPARPKRTRAKPR